MWNRFAPQTSRGYVVLCVRWEHLAVYASTPFDHFFSRFLPFLASSVLSDCSISPFFGAFPVVFSCFLFPVLLIWYSFPLYSAPPFSRCGGNAMLRHADPITLCPLRNLLCKMQKSATFRDFVLFSSRLFFCWKAGNSIFLSSFCVNIATLRLPTRHLRQPLLTILCPL